MQADHPKSVKKCLKYLEYSTELFYLTNVIIKEQL